MLPSKVKIGPQNYKIEFRDPAKDGMLNDGSHGYTLEAGNLIVISKTLDISKQRVTVLHEILHACRFTFEGVAGRKENMDMDEVEHYFIGIYENSLLLVMQDNPELMEWLTETDD